MHQHIRVGLPKETLLVGDPDAAQNEVTAFDQSVKIITDARSKTRIRHHDLL